MTVSTFVQPNMTAQLGNTYKGNIDAAIAALAQKAGNFAPHQATTPNMTVVVDSGRLWSGVVVEKTQQTTGTISAPTTNPRIDRVAIDSATGDVSVVTGTEAASPVAPTLPAGRIPIARCLLSVGQTTITNSQITDERASFAERFRGALVSQTAMNSIPNSIVTALVWDTENYDTSGIYALTPNPSRLTVPAGATKVRLSAGIGFAGNSTGARREAWMRINGGIFIGSPRDLRPPPGVLVAYLTLASPVLNVSPNDYFEVVVLQDSGANLSVTDAYNLFFGMEVLE